MDSLINSYYNYRLQIFTPEVQSKSRLLVLSLHTHNAILSQVTDGSDGETSLVTVMRAQRQ